MLHGLERRELAGVVYAIFFSLKHKKDPLTGRKGERFFNDDGAFVCQDSRPGSR